MIKVGIVDDEQEAIDGIKNLLSAKEHIAVAGSASNGLDAIQMLNEKDVDVLFLDVQMPGISGFDVLNSIERENLPFTIFTTAFDKWAIKAFEQNAVDFLLKPFSDQRFFEALARAGDLVELEKHRHLNESLSLLLRELKTKQKGFDQLIPSYPRKEEEQLFVYRSDGRIRFMEQDKILFFESCDNYVEIVTSSSHELIRKSLTSIIEIVNPRRFVQVHRRFVVNVNHIDFLESLGGGDYLITLNDKQVIKCSRSYKQNLFALIGESLN